MMAKWVYRFGGGSAEGRADMRNLLGGKGANLAEMSALGLPVPPGFTITTEVCTYFYANAKSYPPELKAEVETALRQIEEIVGAKFGDPKKPLLVSVRSGARVSMPGMMDTVLNLGLNDVTAAGLAKQAGDERFAYDSYRRFIQMYGNVVLGVEHHSFEEILELHKSDLNLESDTQLKAEHWKKVIEDYKAKVEEEIGKPFPQDPKEQLWGAIGAVFGSWNIQRAVTYRKINSIPEDWGTAVNVQAMVFGNMGEDCATGVAFTRNPSTGAKEFYGEYLVNAQGEDVVAGIRTPQQVTIAGKKANNSTLPAMEEVMPTVFKQLDEVREQLEKHYCDMQDIEFTVQQGKLYMLQTRNGKRTAAAALKIAVDLCSEGLIDEATAVARIDPASLDQLLHPTLDPKAKKEVVARGLPASPGAASGQIVFTADEAEDRAAEGPRGHPGAGRDQPGGHPRHARRRRHPHHPRRHDQPCGGGGARHGPPLRLRRWRDQGRCRQEDHDGEGPEGRRGRHHHHRRRHRRGDARQGPDHPAAALRRLRQAHVLGRQDAQAEGAHQRRDAARCPHRARVRRRGHRPLPHRAHVLRRHAHRRDARDDHGRHGRGPEKGARQDPADAAPGFHRAVQDHARPAGDHPPARSAACTSSCPTRARRWRRSRRRAGVSVDAVQRARCAAARDPTRCSAIAAAASASPTPRSTRCRRAPSSRRPLPCTRRSARPSRRRS